MTTNRFYQKFQIIIIVSQQTSVDEEGGGLWTSCEIYKVFQASDRKDIDLWPIGAIQNHQLTNIKKS